MRSTRREFIQYVGIALASLLSTRCAPTCYTPAPSSPFLSPTPPGSNPHWLALRKCWLDLSDPRLQSYDDTEFSLNLRERHVDALDALVSSGELSSDVSEEISAAFEQAVAHVQRKMATCYIALPPEFVPREDLARQAAVLEEMAAQSEIDPATVAEAQSSLERDIAWLAEFEARRVSGTLEEVEVGPASVEAAQILIELLLDDQ